MNEIEQIKERLDIVEVVSSYLTLKRAGVNMKGNCPFHNEKTPSFMVSPERQSFKCFGCGEGGDIFTFIEKIEGVDFYNALKILADKAGVDLKPASVKHGGKEYKPDQKTHLFEINDWAKKVYHKILLDHPKADKARKYLKKRGMSDETIKEFQIGYAPDSWDFIIKFLKTKDYKETEMAKAGIAVMGNRDSFYDRFRDRITFPINNVMGNTVAFTSRTMKPDTDPKAGAKYINSSDSPIYHKGKILYGLDKAKMEIKQEDLAVMVEGNMDVIACHQAGFKNVVATSGTAIGVEQLKILTRYAKDVAFSFDSDIAGEIAMKRAITIALENDVSVRIISLPKAYKDPDEAIKADPKNWIRAVEEAKPALEHWIDLLILNKKNLSVIDKKDIAKEILPVIKNIYSDIEKDHYADYLSRKLAVSQKVLMDSLEKTKESKKNPSEEEPIKTLELSDLERILGLLYFKKDFIKKLTKVDLKIMESFKNDQKYSKIVEAVIEKEESLDKWKDDLNQIVVTIERDFSEASDEDLFSELKYLLLKTKTKNKEKIKELYANRIKEAESKGDLKEAAAILKEFSELLKGE